MSGAIPAHIAKSKNQTWAEQHRPIAKGKMIVQMKYGRSKKT
jgi:hypothetical protein